MRHSLEVRVPFLEERLFSYMLQLPVDRVFSSVVHKPLLQNSLAATFGAPWADQEKQGFGAPMKRFMDPGAMLKEIQIGPLGDEAGLDLAGIGHTESSLPSFKQLLPLYQLSQWWRTWQPGSL